MANINDKFPDSVPGRYYVDSQCILCRLCGEIAPANFRESDDGSHDLVYKQPETEEEERLCKRAQEECPVEAIGSDGEVAEAVRLAALA